MGMQFAKDLLKNKKGKLYTDLGVLPLQAIFQSVYSLPFFISGKTFLLDT